jgi:hypothetical protein
MRVIGSAAACLVMAMISPFLSANRKPCSKSCHKRTSEADSGMAWNKFPYPDEGLPLSRRGAAQELGSACIVATASLFPTIQR